MLKYMGIFMVIPYQIDFVHLFHWNFSHRKTSYINNFLCPTRSLKFTKILEDFLLWAILRFKKKKKRELLQLFINNLKWRIKYAWIHNPKQLT